MNFPNRATKDAQIRRVVAYVNQIATISDQDVIDFVSHSREKTFKKGEQFLREGDICKDLLFVYHGAFRYYVTKDGDDFTKDFCFDDTNPFCTGFSSLVTQSPSFFNIEALEDSLVAVWNSTYVEKLFATLPWLLFARNVAQMLYIRKEKREISLLRDSAEQRYRIFIEEFQNVLNRLPQYHIASYLGITPESLSRIRRTIVRRA